MTLPPCYELAAPRTDYAFTNSDRLTACGHGVVCQTSRTSLTVMLDMLANAEERALWRELVARYHYLGHKVAFGAKLRVARLLHLSYPRRELCGCVQFYTAARVASGA